MKITLFCVLLSVLTFFTLPAIGQKKVNSVLVYGTIKNFRNVIEFVDIDYTAPFQITNSERSFVPDSSGRFSIEFSLNQPMYFRLARNIVYLSPGDKFQVELDYAQPKNSNFRGSHSLENEYLKSTPVAKGGSFLAGGQNIKSTIEETFYAMMDSANQRRKLLAGFKTLSPEFRYLEQNRIDADLLNSFYLYRWYFLTAHKLNGDSLIAYNNHFIKFADSFARKYVPMIANAKLMKLEVYRDVALKILRLKNSVGKEVAKINDWFYAKEILHELQTDSSSFNVKKINSIKTPEYRNALLQTYRKLIRLNGTNAADITLFDLNGKELKLSTLKGKVIYIDIWATWCYPCIQEQPYLESLKEKFKGDSNIAFLSLSIDRNIPDWVNYIHKNNLEGLQYVTNLENLVTYHVSEIPRTILIDKDFNIYAMRGPMPSSPELVNLIQRLVQQR